MARFTGFRKSAVTTVNIWFTRPVPRCVAPVRSPPLPRTYGTLGDDDGH